jgi:uncharacterized membrane protein SpoIIM required for sporulation
MSTKSEKFILERKEYWEKLSGIVIKINRKGFNSLTMEEFHDLPNLYRKTCTDSETAKTLELSPDTIEYINNLVLHAHNIFYSSPKKTFYRIRNFFLHDFPESFLKNIGPIAFVFFLFFGIGILTFIIVYLNPKYAENILDEKTISIFKEMYKESPERDIYENIEMAGYYIMNNISIAFASFVLGVTFGIGTIYVIFVNAVSIGCVAGIIASSGYHMNFLSFVLAHSSFELLGICLAGGAGLSLGISMVAAKDEKRSVVFSRKARELMPVIMASAVFIFIAAFIEGFISVLRIPMIVKIVIALASLLFVLISAYRIFIVKLIRKIK